MGLMAQRIPPREQHQLVGWLADYFQTPPTVFRNMTPDKRWDIYHRICNKMLYPGFDAETRRAVYH